MAKSKDTTPASDKEKPTKKGKALETETKAPAQRGRPRKVQVEAPVKDTPEIAENAASSSYIVVSIPLNEIEVDYSINPRNAGEQLEADAHLLDSITLWGVKTPLEVFYADNNMSNKPLLSEGFRRITALKHLAAQGTIPHDQPVPCHVIKDTGAVLLARRIDSNMNQQPYTLADTLRGVRQMMLATDADGKELTTKQRADYFQMSEQAFNKYAAVATFQGGRFLNHSERGTMALDACYKIVLAFIKVEAASGKIEDPQGAMDDIIEKAREIAGEGGKITSKVAEQAAEQVLGSEASTPLRNRASNSDNEDNAGGYEGVGETAARIAAGGGEFKEPRLPESHSALPTPKADKSSPMESLFNKINNFKDGALATYLEGKDTIAAELATLLVDNILLLFNPRIEDTIEESFALSVEYVESK